MKWLLVSVLIVFVFSLCSGHWPDRAAHPRTVAVPQWERSAQRAPDIAHPGALVAARMSGAKESPQFRLVLYTAALTVHRDFCIFICFTRSHWFVLRWLSQGAVRYHFRTLQKWFLNAFSFEVLSWWGSHGVVRWDASLLNYLVFLVHFYLKIAAPKHERLEESNKGDNLPFCKDLFCCYP